MGGLNELALFAGAGGGILGGRLLGWRTVCAVERDAYAAQVLAQRQNDGTLEPFPVWSDVRSFDGRPWRGCVDVISGGFPCQDISVAGKGAGIEGERSGLWSEFARIIGEVRPRFVFVENSPALVVRGLGTVLGSLASMGYDAEWCVLGAHHVGAPHRRDRIWILARSDGFREQQPERSEQEIGSRVGYSGAKNAANVDSPRCEEQRERVSAEPEYETTQCRGWWESEPGLDRVANGVAHRVDRLRAIGNGQVPAVAATAFRILRERIGK